MNQTTFKEKSLDWQVPYFVVDREPILIRLSANAGGVDALGLAGVYIVVDGFLRLLRDVDVKSYRHSLGHEGLVFFVEVSDSRSAIRAYLNNLKRFHFLGSAWNFTIIEGTRLTAITGDPLRSRPLTQNELEDLAMTHLSMGSRPLRFSRYFLYSALGPFARNRGYGTCLLDREDAKGRENFYYVLQGLDVLRRAFQSIDFSGISSLAELRSKGKVIQKALSDLSGMEGFMKGMLFQSLLLACVYEAKTPFEKIPEAIRDLCRGLDRDYDLGLPSRGVMAYHRHGVGGIRSLAMAGFTPLIDQALPMYEIRQDLDDLSLFLLSNTVDTTTLADLSMAEYAGLQELARRALYPGDQDRAALDDFFYHNALVTNGIRDLIMTTQLLLLMKKEEDDREDLPDSNSPSDY